MKTLVILDPLEHLNIEWDTTVYFVTELARRGHETWICDTPDLMREGSEIVAHAKRVRSLQEQLVGAAVASNAGFERTKTFTGNGFTTKFECTENQVQALASFEVILNRKEPPMNQEYLRMLDLLEEVSDSVRVYNDPRGIRETNEKLSILEFPQFIPETLVTRSWQEILAFQEKLGSDLVIKPLDNKGGTGVRKFKIGEKSGEPFQAPHMVQRALPGGHVGQDKRIFLLNGDLLAAAERHPPKGEFRANLGLGAIYHKTELTEREKNIIQAVGPFLRKRGLHFVGIDVMSEKLLEINVTCTGGLCETTALAPEAGLVEAWANSLEHPHRQA